MTDITIAANGLEAQNPVILYLAEMGSEKSIPVIKDSLFAMMLIMSNAEGLTHDMIFSFPWHLMRQPQVIILRRRMRQEFSINTCNARLAALRGVLKKCMQLSLIPVDVYLTMEIKNIRGEEETRGRHIEQDDMLKLFTELRNWGDIGVRNLAILTIARFGIRRAEIVNVELSDYDPETGALTVRAGKGRKDNVIYLTGSALKYLQDWLTVRGDTPGRLICSFSTHGKVLPTKKIGDKVVYKLITELAAKVEIEHVTPHDFKRTMIGEALDAGVDIKMVAKMVGHKSTKTTEKYDRRPERTRKEAFNSIELPEV